MTPSQGLTLIDSLLVVVYFHYHSKQLPSDRFISVLT